ncbi:unnamed protein product [Acanthoscelides obtectus]|uniref:HTH psq-type domain-containing protein n=1 Tax=Acanthoscelides obtectus TaxID=200917 RepID=A0A9P0M5C3_ACAOB|nr:unnamed protein product [Acanthoscelides obtectus]CAK1671736.1 hypothetical protein AOBTE_LOCUS28423 [Acanthoscelides obtectus]
MQEIDDVSEIRGNSEIEGQTSATDQEIPTVSNNSRYTKRKRGAGRGNWTEQSLKAAISSVKNGEMTICSASKSYGVPRKTLERRYKCENDKKGPMGQFSMLGQQMNKDFVTHITTMQRRLKISHRFSKKIEKASYDWMQMFLKRNADISLGGSKGVSVARS